MSALPCPAIAAAVYIRRVGDSGNVTLHAPRHLHSSVRATVRDPSDDNKVKHLKKVAADANATDRLHLYKCDLLENGSFDEAIQGCDYVIHSASPFKLGGVRRHRASF